MEHVLWVGQGGAKSMCMYIVHTCIYLLAESGDLERTGPAVNEYQLEVGSVAVFCTHCKIVAWLSGSLSFSPHLLGRWDS